MKSFRILTLIAVAAAVLIPLSLAFGHGGGLDANGGHYNRKTGEYHYHRPRQSAPEATRPAAVTPSSPSASTSGSDQSLRLMADQVLLLREEVRQLRQRLAESERRVEPGGPIEHAAASEGGVSVLFSPHGHCTDAIVAQINGAQESIAVLAYRLTSAPIAAALVGAHERGVQVAIVLDGSQQSDKYSDATFFHNHKMKVFIDSRHAIAHNKVMVIDGKTVITGSFNFSKAAEESNSENLVIISGLPRIAAAYMTEFQRHAQHVVLYQPPAGHLEESATR